MTTAPVPEPPIYVKVAVWLRENPVPPGGDHYFGAWCESARELGPEAIDVLIDLLREAEPNLQYGALLALRQLGVEAWAHDYEPNLYYEVTVPGREPQKIVPRLQATR
ncbi:MAG: hypothetical protein ACRDZ7_00830 [Acidimicrobiia bacterium]